MSSYADGAKGALAGKEPKAPKKEISHVVLRKGKSGGHIIEHHHTHPEHHPREDHVAPNDDALVSHILQTQGTPNPGEASPDLTAMAGAAPGGGAPDPNAAATGAPPAGAAPTGVPGA